MGSSEKSTVFQSTLLPVHLVQGVDPHLVDCLLIDSPLVWLNYATFSAAGAVSTLASARMVAALTLALTYWLNTRPR